MPNNTKKQQKEDFFKIGTRPSTKDGGSSVFSATMRSSVNNEEIPESKLSLQIILDKMTQNTTKLEKAISKIDEKLDVITSRLKLLENRTDSIEKSVDKATDKLKENDISIDHCVKLSEAVVRENKLLKRHVEQLDNRSLAMNLRILGLPDVDEVQDLVAFLTDWIPNSLQLGSSLPTKFIVKAYKIPLPKHGNRNSNLTVLVQLISENVRDTILMVARKRKTTVFQDKKILFFPDLCVETITKRKKLMEVKQQCLDLNFKASLLYPAKLCVETSDNVFIFWDPTDVSRFLAGKKRAAAPTDKSIHTNYSSESE
nr:PREDICTED: uncharacterized protein LOC106706853 [Latimeria chalumnae]|eukprot:XP_014353831.1 PREDICTED: uncharacterized protein LOC106706853 [Latimeria chalumnae]